MASYLYCDIVLKIHVSSEYSPWMGCDCVDLEVVCVGAKVPQTSPPMADFGTNLVTTVDHYGKMTVKPRAKHSK